MRQSLISNNLHILVIDLGLGFQGDLGGWGEFAKFVD